MKYEQNIECCNSEECMERQPNLLAGINRVGFSTNRSNEILKLILKHMKIIQPPTTENFNAFDSHLLAERCKLLSDIEMILENNEAMLGCLFSYLKEI